MGKKNKIIRAGEENEEFDQEADEEFATVLAMRQEKQQIDQSIAVEANKSSYNKAALVQSLEGLSTYKQPFKESFQLCEYELSVPDENDDLAREMAFYDHSLQAVKLGRKKLSDLKIPHIRPKDYFCEHIKTDDHMGRIKDRLILEEKKMEAFELRKNRDFERKFAKKASAVKKGIDSKNGASKDRDYKNESHRDNDKAGGNISGSKRRYEDNMKESSSPDNKQSRYNNDQPTKSFKRKNMDKKYGFGGKDRKRAKLTDSKSLNDLSDFNPRGGKFVRKPSGKFSGDSRPGGAGRGGAGRGGGRPGGAGGRGGGGRPGGAGGRGGNSKPNRPGKDSRSSARKGRASA